MLYGTTWFGGSGANGTLFAINTNGTGFKVVYNFSPTVNSTNLDGANPVGALALSGDTLCGAANQGGTWSRGTVFAVKTDGTSFRNLHNLTNMDGGYSGYGTNNDGAYPNGGLVLSGDNLYGTAQYGGTSTWGTVFCLKTDGSGFNILHTFTFLNNETNADGVNPADALAFSGTTLYGIATGGGTSDNGTVFSIFLPPQLTISASGTNVILTRPTNYLDFSLQSTTNLLAPVGATNLADPVVVNELNTVTDAISSVRHFYRLSR